MLKDVYQKSIKEVSTEGAITSLGYNLQRWWLGTLFIPNEGSFDGLLWIFTFIPSLLAPLIDDHCLEIIGIWYLSNKKDPRIKEIQFYGRSGCVGQ